MPTTQVINMTARSSSSLNYNDFLYLTKEAPLTDEKVQASVVRDYVLSGVKTSANSGLAQTSSAYAAANPEYELSVDASNLGVVTAVAADYILIQDVTDDSTKKALISDVVSTGDITEVQAGTGITVTNGTGPIPTVALTSPVTVVTGGTGQTTYTNGQILIGNTTGNTLTKATLTAGSNVTITNGTGSISVAATDTDTTYTAGDGLDLTGTTFSTDLMSNGGLEITSTELSVAAGISQYDVAQFAASVADDDFLRIDGTAVEGRSASEVLTDIGASPVAGSSSIVTVGTISSGTIEGEGGILSTGETGAVKYLREDGDGTSSWQAVSGAGIGDVVGPGVAVDESVARFSTTSGKLIQDTGLYFKISDTGAATGYSITLDGDKNITPGDGSMIHVDTTTLTDNVTSTSGTATKFTSNSFEGQTLAATNASVTTTDAATVYISGPTIAGTNETLTRTHALWVDSGNARFDGSIYSGTTEAINSSGLVTVANQSNITGVSTITSGTWNGTEVGLGYGGTELVGETDGKIVIADGAGAPVHLDVGSSTGITILGTVATGTWNGTAIDGTYIDLEGTELKSTGETGGTKFLREDGDDSCSWQTVAAGATAGFAVAMAIAL